MSKFGAADLQKAFGREAQSQGVPAAAKKAAVIWATGVPVGPLALYNLPLWSVALVLTTQTFKGSNNKGHPYKNTLLLRLA